MQANAALFSVRMPLKAWCWYLQCALPNLSTLLAVNMVFGRAQAAAVVVHSAL